MAIFHLNARIVSRGKGQSAVAKAAYNSHGLLTNENTGDRHDYRYKGDVVFSGIFAPRSAPEWVIEIAQNRQALWSAVEKAETRINSQLAREIEIALPHELTDQQREWLVKDFVRENFVRHGMIADVAIHAPSAEGDQRNHHAHILLTMRHIGPEGFAEKMREYNSKGHLQEWREKWEHLANRYLERFGHEAHIDHRTLEAQGIDREPTTHEGPTATDFERQGTKTERGDINREIKARNRLRDQLLLQSGQTVHDLAEARAQYMAKGAEEIRTAWKASPDGLDFMMEINERGFCLARDGKTHYAAVDANGFVHRLDAKTYGDAAHDMSAAVHAVHRDCKGLIIPTVEERWKEMREQREQRRAAQLGATLYDRADMVSTQRDAMRHLKDMRRRQEQQERQREERGRYQTKKQAPRDQSTQKSEHKRATTEQSDAKQRQAGKQSAMERAFSFRATDEERERSGDYEHERER